MRLFGYLVPAFLAALLFASCFSFGAAQNASEPVSTATIWDYINTNGSFFTFASVASRYDDLWPLMAGFPPGTVVTPEILPPSGSEGLRRRMLWGGPLWKRQAGSPASAEKYTVFAPTDRALSEFFNSIPTLAVLQSPFGFPFWRLVSGYHVANGTFELASLGEFADLPTLTKYASANYTAPNRINSAHLLSDEPVRCGNGLLYAIDRFIWPWDYTEILPGFNFGVNEAINLAIDVNHLAAA